MESDMLQEEDRSAGILLNITGNGKGKTTSAFGIAVRALGWDWNVVFLQFVKGGTETGEKRFFSSLNHPSLRFEQLGAGLSWHPGDHKGMAEAGWKRAAEFLRSDQVDLLVMDELNIALHYQWLELNRVLDALKRRPAHQNVVITGRYAPAPLLELSDLVSEIRSVKHPFEKGIPAIRGIDF